MIKDLTKPKSAFTDSIISSTNPIFLITSILPIGLLDGMQYNLIDVLKGIFFSFL